MATIEGMTIIDEAPPIAKPADAVVFNCNMCGECCSSWNIPIEGDKARRLVDLEWVQARLKEHNRELQKVDESLYRLPLTDENVCVFLAEDKRCLIEVYEGPALKPTECQRFPFAGVRVQGDLHYDTSASCKQIAETLLLAFQPIVPRAEDSALPIIHEDAETLPAKIRLGLFTKIDAVGYTRYQNALAGIFQQAGNPGEALNNVRRLLFTLKGHPFKGKLRKPGNEDPVTTFFLRKPYGSLSWWQLLRGGKYEDPRVFGLTIDLHSRTKVQWNPEQDRLLNAFLFSLLNRKILLARGGSLESLLAMSAVAAVLVRWYATVLADLQDRKHVETNDVTVAIRLVERYYTGHQPRFLQFFASRWRAKLVSLKVL